MPIHPDVVPFGAILVASIVVGIASAFWCSRVSGVGRETLFKVQAVATLAALLGAKLFSLIERSGVAASLEQEFWSGYRYPGGIAGAIVSLLVLRWTTSADIGRVADTLAPGIGLAMATMRVGCLLAGCCTGSPVELPWAMTYPAKSPPWRAHVAMGLISPSSEQSLSVHPLPLYFFVLSLSVAVFAWWLLRRTNRLPGIVFVVVVASYAVGQYFLESLRLNTLPGVQFASALVALIAFGMLLWMIAAVRPAPVQDRAHLP